MSVLAVYPRAIPESTAWAEPVESISQRLSRFGRRAPRARRGDISLAHRLFMAAVVAMPREDRYGLVSWCASLFGVSRQTVYDIAHLLHSQAGGADLELSREEVSESRGSADDECRLKRAVLTFALPGGLTLRPMRQCLEETLGRRPSVGWLSEFLAEAGDRAGKVLDSADWSAVEPFVAARDEKFFDDRAYLATVHPSSLAVVSAHVETSVDRDRWAVSLGLDQIKTRHAIAGLVEDAAPWYPGSASDASAMSGSPYLVPVQKDHFHCLRRAGEVQRHLDNVALGKLATAERKAIVDGSGRLRIRDFDKWEAAHAEAEVALDKAQSLHFWTQCVDDALQLVEPRTGAIRDAATSSWYLDQIIEGLSQIDDRQVQSLATYLRNQRHELFTYLEWLAPPLDAWRAQADAHFVDRTVAVYFERSVATAWHLVRRAAGRDSARARRAASNAKAFVEGLCHNDPSASRLAFELTTLLDEAVRTTSSVENLNSILARYLYVHKGFPSDVSARRYLNLLVLWHGMRRFDRGKRQGQSPFEIAGVRIVDPAGNPTDDWRAALGYPAAA